MSGTRVLPPPAGENTTTSAWAAHLCMDADQRTKHPEYATLAARLIIRGGEVHEPPHR